MASKRTIAEASLEFSGLFEVEVLLELMMRFWGHPLASNREFRSFLLENAAEALRVSVAGTVLIEDVKPQNMNTIAAIWYVECNAVEEDGQETVDFAAERKQWLEQLRRSLPSCFCNPNELVDPES